MLDVYKRQAVNSILANSPERLIEVFVLKGREDKRLHPLLNELYALGIAVQFVNRQTLDKKSNGEVHQGVIARVQEAKELNEHDLDELLTRKQNPLLLVLDGVTDPHNLGACLRTADAAGVSAVIVPKDKSAQLLSLIHISRQKVRLSSTSKPNCFPACCNIAKLPKRFAPNLKSSPILRNFTFNFRTSQSSINCSAGRFAKVQSNFATITTSTPA